MQDDTQGTLSQINLQMLCKSNRISCQSTGFKWYIKTYNFFVKMCVEHVSTIGMEAIVYDNHNEYLICISRNKILNVLNLFWPPKLRE